LLLSPINFFAINFFEKFEICKRLINECLTLNLIIYNSYLLKIYLSLKNYLANLHTLFKLYNLNYIIIYHKVHKSHKKFCLIQIKKRYFWITRLNRYPLPKKKRKKKKTVKYTLKIYVLIICY